MMISPLIIDLKKMLKVELKLKLINLKVVHQREMEMTKLAAKILLLRLQLQHLNHLLLHQNKNEKEELKDGKESHQGEEQEAGVEVGEEIQEEIQEMKENTEEVAADVGNVIEIIEEEVGTGTGKEETEENNKKEEEEVDQVDQADQVEEVMKGGQLIGVDNIQDLMIHTMAKRKYSDLRLSKDKVKSVLVIKLQA